MHTLKVFYRPDNYPEWVPWRDFSQRFNIIGNPGSLDAGGLPIARAGFDPRVSFGKPANKCDPNTNRRLRRGFEFQVKLQGTGHVVIDKFRIHAQRIVERSRAQC